jgi:hypothetical protein
MRAVGAQSKGSGQTSRRRTAVRRERGIGVCHAGPVPGAPRSADGCLAGSNLKQYLFESEDDAASGQAEQVRAQFVCNGIFLLADRDIGKEEKHKHLEELQSDGFRYYVTPGVEVENLISEADLKRVLPQLVSGLTEEQVKKAKIRDSEYREKRLGSYLGERLGNLCPDGLRAASGTLSAYYKDKLATLACQSVTWENMSEDARKLARDLYEFVCRHNRVAPGLVEEHRQQLLRGWDGYFGD